MLVVAVVVQDIQVVVEHLVDLVVEAMVEDIVMN
jgi:hypothetical protein